MCTLDCMYTLDTDKAAREGKSAAATKAYAAYAAAATTTVAAMWGNCVRSRCGRYIHVLFRFGYTFTS